jgi:hypothetical protein
MFYGLLFLRNPACLIANIFFLIIFVSRLHTQVHTHTIMKHILLGSTALLLLLTFTTCKKGPDDPFISLRSRTARLAGEWQLQSGTASYTSHNSVNESFTFDGVQLHANITAQNVIYIGSYILNLSILKNGTFTMNELIAGNTLNAQGTWSFNSGIGDDKKKEDVAFFIDKVNKGTTADEHLFNRSNTQFFYKLTELRNKKLVMQSVGKVYTGNDYYDFTTEYTFIQ